MLEDTTGTNVLATTTTDATGYYHFAGLSAGQYTVQFVAPTGGVFTTPLQGGNMATDSDANSAGLTAPVTLVSGQNDTTIDAGVYQPAALGDYVWLDANANGVQDGGEAGIAGVTVTLEDASGTTVLATTTTDATGHYAFTGLTPGQYEVQFVAPTGGVFTTPLQGGNTGTDSDANSAGLTAPVTLVSGQNDTTIDAGIYQPAALGDYVWLDANANGVQDGDEAGIAGVTVTLENASGTTVLATTTTDATGHYAFTGLTPGQYTVQFVAPTGGVFTTPLQGGNTALDSDANSVGLTAPITLVSGQNDTTIDAGVYQPAALGDYVWLDANANGVQDGGEAGIAGVTVTLEDASGTTGTGDDHHRCNRALRVHRSDARPVHRAVRRADWRCLHHPTAG